VQVEGELPSRHPFLDGGFEIALEGLWREDPDAASTMAESLQGTARRTALTGLAEAFANSDWESSRQWAAS
jgi:hypothetical protein